MAASWERYLERWKKAGLIETSTADHIRAYEAGQEKAQGLRWPILLAVALGGLLLAAGILLFVAAHWERLSPTQRFTLVLSLVAVMHVAGALTATRFRPLSTVFHAVGTICLGAGIFLTGQIFHLQEHWPGGVMLWALGAWAAWVILRDWPQAVLAAILTPAWLAGEWSVATQGWVGSNTILAAGLLMLSISYLTALLPKRITPVRVALSWIGGLTIIPAVVFVVMSGSSFGYWRQSSMPTSYKLLGVVVALLPLLLAWLLRGRHVWLNVISALWVMVLSLTSFHFWSYPFDLPHSLNDLSLYAACALGSIGLIMWGMKEGRKERVNLGIAGFALTVLFFYFSSVMDKLGRSASLIGLGFLFLLGGWLLEKTRRRLVAKIGKGAT